ncbi:MAG TPA: hypothetical protein VF011_14190 [Terriglobales bacterium]
MKANSGDRASPHWRVLYRAAILEIDVNKLGPLIVEAQNAIMDRIEDLNHSCDSSESGALMDALNVLRDLRRMADADGQAQNYKETDQSSIPPPSPNKTPFPKKQS